MGQQFVFNNKGAEFYRAQTKGLRDFEAVIQWFSEQAGVRSRGHVIDLARKTRPDGFNEWMASGRRRQTMTAATPVQAMRLPSGAPLVQFRG